MLNGGAGACGAGGCDRCCGSGYPLQTTPVLHVPLLQSLDALCLACLPV
jgi:hypothetical protein